MIEDMVNRGRNASPSNFPPLPKRTQYVDVCCHPVGHSPGCGFVAYTPVVERVRCGYCNRIVFDIELPACEGCGAPIP